MAYEQRPGDFVLFKNDKGDNEKRPDYRGDGIDLDGRNVEVACWIKQGKKGKFMSCKMKVSDGAKAKAQAAKPREEDEIPF